MNNRRQFIVQVGLSSGVLMAGQTMAQAVSVSETDPQAAALGYKANSAKVDAAKYPKHVAAQQCKNCALYQGKPADVAGGCPLYAGKQVAAIGWCSAWVQKAA